MATPPPQYYTEDLRGYPKEEVGTIRSHSLSLWGQMAAMCSKEPLAGNPGRGPPAPPTLPVPHAGLNSLPHTSITSLPFKGFSASPKHAHGEGQGWSVPSDLPQRQPSPTQGGWGGEASTLPRGSWRKEPPRPSASTLDLGDHCAGHPRVKGSGWRPRRRQDWWQ